MAPRQGRPAAPPFGDRTQQATCRAASTILASGPHGDTVIRTLVELPARLAHGQPARVGFALVMELFGDELTPDHVRGVHPAPVRSSLSRRFARPYRSLRNSLPMRQRRPGHDGPGRRSPAVYRLPGEQQKCTSRHSGLAVRRHGRTDRALAASDPRTGWHQSECLFVPSAEPPGWSIGSMLIRLHGEGEAKCR
jgi:hypothetical protein